MGVLAQRSVFVGVGEEKDSGGAGAKAGGHVIDGVADLGLRVGAVLKEGKGGRGVLFRFCGILGGENKRKGKMMEEQEGTHAP